jgi:hypothetical protein
MANKKQTNKKVVTHIAYDDCCGDFTEIYDNRVEEYLIDMIESNDYNKAEIQSMKEEVAIFKVKMVSFDIKVRDIKIIVEDK